MLDGSAVLVENAAVAAARTMGFGDRHKADEVAVEIPIILVPNPGGDQREGMGPYAHHLLRLLDPATCFGGAGLSATLEPFDLASHPPGQGGLLTALVLEELLALLEEVAVGAVHAEDAAGEGMVELDDAADVALKNLYN